MNSVKFCAACIPFEMMPNFVSIFDPCKMENYLIDVNDFEDPVTPMKVIRISKNEWSYQIFGQNEWIKEDSVITNEMYEKTYDKFLNALVMDDE